MTNFIDKRHNFEHKHAVNRQRFMQRCKQQISKAAYAVGIKKNIQDFAKEDVVHLPLKDSSEPSFKYATSANLTTILPGNRNYNRGDQIPLPPKISQEAADSQASNSPETGEDSFNFTVGKDEFLELFFENLELPNFLKKHVGSIKAKKLVRGGFASEGNPTNINVVRTMRKALARKIIQKNSKKQAVFLDPVDLVYNRKTVQTTPNLKAVIFCLMDVSGSMDEIKKDLAKRFFILLHLFLKRSYETIEIVFIRHHTGAKEVDEQSFFYSRETGGTVVSSALELMRDVMQRYPASEWNLYGAQASDGDNWNNDSPYCKELLFKQILPLMQYFVYLEIMPRHHQSLWEEYSEITNKCPNFAIESINSAAEIFPTFKQMFAKNKQFAKEG